MDVWIVLLKVSSQIKQVILERSVVSSVQVFEFSGSCGVWVDRGQNRRKISNFFFQEITHFMISNLFNDISLISRLVLALSIYSIYCIVFTISTVSFLPYLLYRFYHIYCIVFTISTVSFLPYLLYRFYHIYCIFLYGTNTTHAEKGQNNNSCIPLGYFGCEAPLFRFFLKKNLHSSFL